MKAYRFIPATILSFCIVSSVIAQKQTDYMQYHRNIGSAEKLISNRKYAEALAVFEKVFDSYEYIFLRDYKAATQLALFLKDEAKAFVFMRSGISGGWTLKQIEANKFLAPLQKRKEWEIIKSDNDSLRNIHNKRLNQQLRAEVRAMFKHDQRLDFPYYLRIGQKAKERYAMRRFKPNSEKQLARLNEILNQYGYPGEKLIGNNIWMSTILSHHNSISTEYTRRDTLYTTLKPRLLIALSKGEISPDDYAIIEDWYIAVKFQRQKAAYGYLNPLLEDEVSKANELRQSIGLRSIEIRNALIDIQAETGMNFYLDGTLWVKRKINIVNKR